MRVRNFTPGCFLPLAYLQKSSRRLEFLLTRFHGCAPEATRLAPREGLVGPYSVERSDVRSV